MKEGFMKYAVEIGLGTVMYIPRLKRIGSAIKKSIGGFTETQTAWRSHKPTLRK
jgi:hypothetical protein